MIDLSIVIVNFNTKQLTLGCIESIKQSGSKISYEIIVVDNGSTDGSQKELGLMDDSILLIKNPVNLGYAKANNQGIKKVTGDYILLLNSDTIAKKQSLDKLLSFAKKTPNAGVVGARLLNFDNTLQPSVFYFPTITRAIDQYWLGRQEMFELYVPKVETPIAVDAVVGAAFLITPKALKKVGLLDEKYFMYFEDLDYCRRVWQAGLKVYYLPRSEIIHYHGASGKDVVKPAFQWKRLIPSSKIYHGLIKHYLINFIIFTGQKWQRLIQRR